MKPADVVHEWVARFNQGDADGLAELYDEDAVNHQVVTEPIRGRKAIREFLAAEFERAEMTCLPETIHEAGDWAILEWKDPLGLRGCGFFHVRNGKIVHQRGYFDQLTFFRLHGLPVPDEFRGA